MMRHQNSRWRIFLHLFHFVFLKNELRLVLERSFHKSQELFLILSFNIISWITCLIWKSSWSVILTSLPCNHSILLDAEYSLPLPTKKYGLSGVVLIRIQYGIKRHMFTRASVFQATYFPMMYENKIPNATGNCILQHSKPRMSLVVISYAYWPHTAIVPPTPKPVTNLK